MPSNRYLRVNLNHINVPELLLEKLKSYVEDLLAGIEMILQIYGKI